MRYYNPYLESAKQQETIQGITGTAIRVTSMFRYGVIQSTNSSIHAVCVALRERGYELCLDVPSKEQYVENLRGVIWQNIHPSLLKQEMYDYDNAEIAEMFTKSEYNLTSLLFYRALEEYFNGNIYVFSPPRPKSSESKIGFMNVPRYKISHSRTYRPDRQTILLFLTWGSESNALKYPHCELIVEELSPGCYNMVFPMEMTQLVHDTLLLTTKTLTWSESDFSMISNLETRDQHDIGIHENLYSKINYLSTIPYHPMSQLLDSNSKLRALTFQGCLLYTSPSPRDATLSRMPSSA